MNNEPLGIFRMGTIGPRPSKKERQMQRGHAKIMRFVQRGIAHDPFKRKRSRG